MSEQESFSQETKDGGLSQDDKANREGGNTDVLAQIGVLLKTARLEKNITLDAVASDIKLSIKNLESLESGQSTLGLVFIKGLVRSYARFLAVDVTELLAKLEGDEELADLDGGLRDRVVVDYASHSKSKTTRVLGVIVVILLVIGASIYAFYGKDFFHTDSNSTSDSQEVTVDESAAIDKDTEKVIKPALDKKVSAKKDTKSDIQKKTVEAALIRKVVKANLKAKPEKESLDLLKKKKKKKKKKKNALPRSVSFGVYAKDNSWLQVTDVKGKVILDKELPKEVRKKLSAELPAKLIVGDYRSVVVTYHGKPVKWTVLPGNVGVFTLTN